MRARDPARPPWDRRRFLREMWEDNSWYPGAEELAGKFEQAIATAQGSPARFEQELDRLLG